MACRPRRAQRRRRDTRAEPLSKRSARPPPAQGCQREDAVRGTPQRQGAVFAASWPSTDYRRSSHTTVESGVRRRGLKLAKQLLGEQPGFYPFGYVMGRTGKLSLLSGYTGEEHG